MRWFVLLFNGRRLFSDKVNKGGMGLPSIDAILSTRRYHLAYLSTRQRFNPGALPVISYDPVLVVAMVGPYFLCQLFSRFLFRVDLPQPGVCGSTVCMPNFAAIGLPLLHSVYGHKTI
jgi:malonate transporter